MKLSQLQEAKYYNPNRYEAWLKDPANKKAIRALHAEIVDEFQDMSDEEKRWLLDMGTDLGEYDAWAMFPTIEQYDEYTHEWIIQLTKEMVDAHLAG